MKLSSRLLLVIGVVSFCCMSISVYAYTPGDRDKAVMGKTDAALEIITETGGKERLVSMFYMITQASEDIEDERSLYLLEYVLLRIANILQTDFEVTMTRDALVDDAVLLMETTIENSNSSSEEGENNKEDKEDEETKTVSTSTVVMKNDKVLYDLEKFYATYKGYVTSSTPISELCTTHFDKIDAIAKEYDFPTALIIATWYREHTCIFSNPANNRGNFQITSHSYPPGDISWAEFENQIINFILFSRAKWDYYDDIQKYGPEPITLSYDAIDLTSLRKHAILYNGVSGTLESNVYANQNFGKAVNGRDGIVAMTLRALGWQLNQDKSGLLTNNTLPIESETTEPEETDEEESESNDEKVTETDDCEEIFTENLGPDANHQQVLAMQKFLRDEGFYTGTPNGVYDDKSTQAVNAFQAYYKTEILDPGGYTSPTGYRYPATRKKANALICE